MSLQEIARLLIYGRPHLHCAVSEQHRQPQPGHRILQSRLPSPRLRHEHLHPHHCHAQRHSQPSQSHAKVHPLGVPSTPHGRFCPPSSSSPHPKTPPRHCRSEPHPPPLLRLRKPRRGRRLSQQSHSRATPSQSPERPPPRPAPSSSTRQTSPSTSKHPTKESAVVLGPCLSFLFVIP
jgi:hypothetical protein